MRCIIVDDEAPARAELRFFIENTSRIEVAREFENAIDALEYMGNSVVDCIFLDIHMPHLDGMAFAKVLSRTENGPKVVFVTAHQQYAIEAFEVEAFDYLLKPYSEERIIKVLRKLEESLQSKHPCDKLTLWKKDKMVVVSMKDILYCKASERATEVFTMTERFVVSCNITEFYNKLPEEQFFRSHRSFVVNLDHIDEIIPWFNNTYVLKVKGLDEEIPVSRNNMKAFKGRMSI